jgi:hypothetical protein
MDSDTGHALGSAPVGDLEVFGHRPRANDGFPLMPTTLHCAAPLPRPSPRARF